MTILQFSSNYVKEQLEASFNSGFKPNHSKTFENAVQTTHTVQVWTGMDLVKADEGRTGTVCDCLSIH